ncbi:MAG: hypothetical protein ACLP56_18535, partial [Candidatus Sulfotelmatobacter sp.]
HGRSGIEGSSRDYLSHPSSKAMHAVLTSPGATLIQLSFVTASRFAKGGIPQPSISWGLDPLAPARLASARNHFVGA